MKRRTMDPLTANVPKFISSAPWYAEDGEANVPKTITYEPDGEDKSNWYARGQTAGPAAKKFRKGACENCGAITHKTKECVERPRKVGAKWTNKDIKPDEVVRDVKLGYDAKRDRWNGYDPAVQKLYIDQYNEREEERRKLKEVEVEKDLMTKKKEKRFELGDLSSDSEDEGKKADDDMHVPEAKVDTFTRTTIRNLRIREDTAKYLKNIRSNDDNYNPKTRSFKTKVDETGEFIKYTGDAPKVVEMNVFAWETQNRGVDVNVMADPTKTEYLYKQYQKKKEEVKGIVQTEIIKKYGAENMQKLPKELLMGQSDEYVEYNQTGTIVKTRERTVIRSIYEEDNYEKYSNGHSSIWGSYYDKETGLWGYLCCKKTDRRLQCS